MKHYTTIEQSKRLLELGMNPETADMHHSKWTKIDNIDYVGIGYNELDKEEYGDVFLPCWSLGSLLEVMPRYIHSGRYINSDIVDCPLSIFPFDVENTRIKEHCWIICYTDYDEELDDCNFRIEQRGNNLIDAAFNMVVWLLENNYITRIDNGKD